MNSNDQQEYSRVKKYHSNQEVNEKIGNKKVHNNNFFNQHKKLVIIVAVLVIILLGLVFIIRKSTSSSGEIDAIIQRNFNSQENDVTSNLNQGDMITLEQLAQKSNDKSEYLGLARAGMQAINVNKKIDDLKNGQGLYKTPLTSSDVKQVKQYLSQQGKLTSVLTQYYKRTNDRLQKIIDDVQEVNRLHKLTNSYFISNGQLYSTVTKSDLRKLRKELKKYQAYQRAVTDYNMVQDALEGFSDNSNYSSSSAQTTYEYSTTSSYSTIQSQSSTSVQSSSSSQSQPQSSLSTQESSSVVTSSQSAPH